MGHGRRFDTCGSLVKVVEAVRTFAPEASMQPKGLFCPIEALGLQNVEPKVPLVRGLIVISVFFFFFFIL